MKIFPKKLMNEKMRIGIICGYPFPKGMAATTRIIAYSKGLIENNVNVDVILFNPTEKGDPNIPSKGVFQRINYCYPFRKYRVKNKIFHSFELIIGIITTFFYVIHENKKLKFDALIISSDNIIILFIFSVLSKIINAKSIFIFDEFPIPIRKYLKNYIPYYKKLLYSIVLRQISAYIAMTDSLVQFYNQICPKPTHILSTITDISRFDGIQNQNPDKRILCYMGNMDLKKDNVDNIIRAFGIIHQTHPNFELHLFGLPSNHDKLYLDQIIKEENLNSFIFFKGRVDYDSVPQLLKNSYILLTSQPCTKRAEGGFPTKLGEYLASKVPCLLTDVGEIRNYVQDDVNVFICKAEDPIDYAIKLGYIIQNYSFSQDVALNGYNYLASNFSHKAVAYKLLTFIKSINYV